ncbi:hypothetical protein LOK49_LG01G03567 [Camellia lanceoleosa]|uniref:Uncharacterized protein n=1 Tax=Camellia lanceoleosa TaxID=1840588 RepID=A0ACC0J4A1_9ERIC|nr:hypothetical protein LOK49_LG01G03567 [Camellia lanceoleosa]
MLAHHFHLQLLSSSDCKITILDDFKYKSIDGDLVGVVGDSWVLKSSPVSVTWHSIEGINEESYPEIVAVLIKDVEAQSKEQHQQHHHHLILTEKQLRAKKISIIAEEVGCFDAIPVLAKIDLTWERNYRPQAYSLMAYFMNLGRRENSKYPRLRCFDLWKLHSWAGGLTEFADGRNQESTSEAVNAYYSAALIGLAYGDTHLVATASTIAAMEVHSAQTWWHVKEGGTMVGIQLLPLLPITEVLFCESGFVRDLVASASKALGREGVLEGWKGFLHALEGVYDKESALGKIRNLNGFGDGNSLTNLLWWIHSRVEEEKGYKGGGKNC